MVVNSQPLHRFTGYEYLRFIGEDIFFEAVVEGFGRNPYYAVVNNWDHEDL